jgi:hypothetical protein
VKPWFQNETHGVPGCSGYFPEAATAGKSRQGQPQLLKSQSGKIRQERAIQPPGFDQSPRKSPAIGGGTRRSLLPPEPGVVIGKSVRARHYAANRGNARPSGYTARAEHYSRVRFP